MFVGTVVFRLDGPVCRHVTDAVHDEVERLPGVRRCAVDVAGGTLVVTADQPVDRTDILAILDRVGCRVHT